MFSSAVMPPCSPMMTSRPSLRERVDVPVEVGRAHDVEDHVGARACGLLADAVLEVLVAVVDRDVGAERASGVKLLRRTGGDRDPGPQRPRHLNPVGADSAAATVDQHRLPGPQARRHHQVRPDRARDLRQTGRRPRCRHRRESASPAVQARRRTRRSHLRPATRKPLVRPPIRRHRRRPRRSHPKPPYPESGSPRAVADSDLQPAANRRGSPPPPVPGAAPHPAPARTSGTSSQASWSAEWAMTARIAQRYYRRDSGPLATVSDLL